MKYILEIWRQKSIDEKGDFRKYLYETDSESGTVASALAELNSKAELTDINVRLQLLHLRHATAQVLEIKGFQSTCQRITAHTDSAASVYQQYATLHQAGKAGLQASPSEVFAHIPS